MKWKRYRYIGDLKMRIPTKDCRVIDLYTGDFVDTVDGVNFVIPNKTNVFKLTKEGLKNFERYYTEEELKHWEDLREKAAIAAMQGIVSNQDRTESIAEYLEPGETFHQKISAIAVDLANKLIEELKKD